MAGNKGVVRAFRRLGETGHAAKLPQMGKPLPPRGEQLVDIALMSDVKYKSVARGIVF